MATYNIEFLAEVDSTNSYLRKKAAEQPLPAQYAVCASVQLHGKGQRGNTWKSEAFLNLTASFVVKNPGNILELSWLNNAAAIATTKTLEVFGVSRPTIKWPNDVYIGDRKIAGILTENILINGHVSIAVVGIGVNVNQLKFDGIPATSIAAVTGSENDITDLLQSLYLQFYSSLEVDKHTLLQQVNERLYKKDTLVTFEHEGRFVSFTVKNLLKNGNLEVSDGTKSIEIEHHRTKWLK